MSSRLNYRLIAAAVSLLSISLPSFSQSLTPGSIADNFSVDSGRVNYSIPISVPVGRGGMQPSLSLDYTDGGNGLLGVGWSLSGVSSITRCRATMVQDGYAGRINYDAKDRYCLDGQRLIKLSSGAYRTELDSYAKIESFGGTTHNPGGFIVRTKSGQVMTFGGKTNSYYETGLDSFFTILSTVTNQNKGRFAWLLTEINDTTGQNPVTFNYNANKHIQNIRYGHNQINFTYENRDDVVYELLNGLRLTTTKRLKTIFTRTGDEPLFNYQLRYQSRPDNQQSYLSSVTRCGSGHCLPSINLAWSGLTASAAWRSESNYGPKASASRDTKANRGVEFVDVNGDGLVDQLYHRYNSSSSTAKGAFLNTGSGWKRDNRFTPKFHISNKDGIDLGSRFVDLNGDGLVDQVYRRYLGNDQWQKGAYINTGSGWKSDSDFAPRVSFVNKDGKDYGGRLIDVNGDGLVDHVFHRKGVRKGAYINTGSGWKKDESYAPLFPIVNEEGTNLGSVFVDLNGDGLVDQIGYSGHGKKAYINTGSGWEERSLYKPRRATIGSKGKDNGSRFIDVNGDGLVDQVYNYGDNGQTIEEGAYLNTGIGWTRDDRYIPEMYTAYDGRTDIGSRFVDVNGDGLVDQIKNRINSKGGHVKKAYLGTGNGWKRDDSYAPKRLISRHGVEDMGSRFMDVNGDGFVDQVFHHYNKSGNLVDEGAYLNRSKRVALKSITHGSGSLKRNTTHINYKQLSDDSVYSKGNSARFPEIDVVSTGYVVSEVKVSDGIGGTLSTLYHYEGLKVNPQERGSLGFAKITKRYPDTKKREVTEYDQGSFPFTGNVRRVTEYYGSQKINEATYRYNVTTHSSGKRYKLNLERSAEKSYELGNGSTPVTTVVTTNSDIDGYGNIRRSEVKTSGGGETFTKITVSRYKNDSTLWHLGRLLETTVTHRSPYESDQRRRTSFTYDDNNGLLNSQSIISISDGSVLSSTSYRYNSYGQKTRTEVSASGEASRISKSAYDSHGRLIESCNVYNQCETHTYNTKSQLATTTSPNGLTTRWYYDAMGRVKSEHRANGTNTTTAFYFANSGECGELANTAYSCVVTQSSGTQPAIIQTDRLGREVRKIRQGFDDRLVYSDTEYDNLGQVSRVSRDYYNGDHVYWATSKYDGFGRVIKITEPGPHGGSNDIITRYDGLTTTVISGSDRLEKTTVTNVLGQKIRVEEEEGAYTDYTYNSDGNLLTTEVAGDSGTRITLSYDEFGRKIGMSDPDMGNWTYRYTKYGELASQTDAKGQTVTNTYDRLGRLIRRVEPEGTSRWVFGTNDAPIGSVGKLLSETASGITKVYTYDSLGRPDTTTTTIAGQGSFTTETRYDNLSRVRRIDYPGSTNFYTENVYNDNGFLAQVRGSRNHAETHNLEYLRPLIINAADLAGAYLSQANRLRTLGASYEKTLDNYQKLLSQQVVKFSQGSTAGLEKNIAHPYLHTSNKNISYIKVPDTFVPIYSFGSIVVPIFKKATHHYKVTRSGDTQSVARITAAQFAAVEGSLIDRGDTVAWRSNSSVNCLCSLGSVLVANLDKHRSLLTSTAADGLNMSPEFLGHLNNTLEELKLVTALLKRQALGYENKADELTLLAEQTLAAADHSFQYGATLNASAEAYGDLLDDDRFISYWRALDVDASGRTSAEVYGNGIVTDYAYNLGTGQLQNIHSSLVSLEALRHIEYQYDDYNNVTLRDDLINDIRDTYDYDRLERLTATHTQSDLYDLAAFNGSQSVDFDTIGNMTYKSDVGDYRYGAGSAGPHAVTTAGSHTYRYDANGNMISGNGRSLQWSSFNKPTQITQSGRSAAFSYGADYARFKKVNHNGDTTIYIGKLYERLRKANNQTEEKHYIYAAGNLVAEHIVSSTDGTQTRYLHKDALGSIDTVTDAYANVVDRRSFDSWGKLRNLPWRAQATLDDPLYLTQLPYTNKGYTGHESVQEVDLIHMGGRMYDATLGRFISADPHIQSPSLSQSYNRYSYVINNPMKYNDPSGYFFKRLFKGIGRAIRNIGRAIRPLIGAIGSAAVCSFGGPAACVGFAVGFSSGSTYASTGSIGQAIKSGLIAFATAKASGVVKGFQGLGNKIVGHGLVGGTASVLQGGRFGSGFISSAFAKAVSPTIERLSQAAGTASNIVGTVGASLVGGTVSVIGGGKFANGARTAAIQYLFNQVAADSANRFKSRTLVNEAFADGRLDTSRQFETQEDAASEVLTVLMPITGSTQMEVGGYIYYNDNGTWSYGFPIVGNNHGTVLGDSNGLVGSGYHTHPTRDFITRTPIAQNFSVGDVNWVNTFKIVLFLGQPGDGSIKGCYPGHSSCRITPTGNVGEPRAPGWGLN